MVNLAVSYEKLSDITNLTRKQVKEAAGQEPEFDIVNNSLIHSAIHTYHNNLKVKRIEKACFSATLASLVIPIILGFSGDYFIDSKIAVVLGLGMVGVVMLFSKAVEESAKNIVSFNPTKRNKDTINFWLARNKITLSKKDRKRVSQTLFHINYEIGAYTDLLTLKKYVLEHSETGKWNFAEKKNNKFSVSNKKITLLPTDNLTIKSLHKSVTEKITVLKSYDLNYEQTRVFNTSVKKVFRTSELATKLYQLGDKSHHQEVEMILKEINNDLDAIKQSQKTSIRKKLAKVEERHIFSQVGSKH